MIKISYIIRRNKILEELKESANPIKGQQLAKDLGVTRQVIVKDIAILRAEGNTIIATPEGYMMNNIDTNTVTRIIAVSHKPEEIKDELETVIKYGGIVRDVIIEHGIYGEISANLMLKTLFDIEKFLQKLEDEKVEPLSILTGGIHLHTIEAENEETLDKIINELDNKGIIVKNNYK